MSFLDATGLGTFWGKLKNYFVPKSDTEAPVTGLTDMLTPVNLSTNSNFSRSNGMPITTTFETLGTTNVAEHKIDYNHFASSYNGTFNNVTITRRNGKLTVTATPVTVTDSNNDVILIIYDYKTTILNKHTYTTCVKWSNASGSAYMADTLFGGSTTYTEIYHDIRENDSVRVIMVNTSNPDNNLENVNTQVASIRFKPDMLNVEGSITIEATAMYEGSYKNPPFLNSPDVEIRNPFETQGEPINPINTVKFNTKGWYRLLKIPNAVVKKENEVIRLDVTRIPLHTYYLEPGYHAIGSSNSENYASYNIDFGLIMWTTSETNSSDCVVYLKADALSHSNNYITKFRFARSSTPSKTSGNNVWYDGYLEAYINYTVATDTTRIYVDNLLYAFPRTDNLSGTPDGSDDILLGSEVTPTMIGTTITIA